MTRHVSRQRHAGRLVRSRGSATWPCVPRRIHVGPLANNLIFVIFLLFKTL